MFIPNYQIHNILKDYTQQLKNGHHRPEARCQLDTVVRKVAGTIMRRVVDLSEQEALRRIRSGHHGARRLPLEVKDRQPEKFHYHVIGSDHLKVRKWIAVENPAQLIDRFHCIIEETQDDCTER